MKRAARTARLSILSNAALIALKLAVGFVSGSVSIISEAIHSLMDLAAAFMAFLSIRVAQRPADAEHPYGHEKLENVSGVLEAALIFAASALIIAEAVRKLIRPAPIESLELGVAVMAVAGAVNIFVSRRLYKVAREEESVALEADALHLRTDVYSSLGVALGLLVIVVLRRVFGFAWAYYLDPVIAIAIALFILREAWGMLGKAFGPLIDSSLSAEELEIVRLSVARYPDVSMHEVRTRRAGGKRYIDFHLTVPESMSVLDSHELCDEIERGLEKRLRNTSVLIHTEPAIAVPVGERRALSKDELERRLGEIGRTVAGTDIRVHHLHVFDTSQSTELIFHIDLDSSVSLAEAHALASRFEERVRSELGFEPTIHVEPRKESGPGRSAG
ncbi:MAG TPA: cation diffusion facilitator family transporter [Rectinemataceae bacterium]|nr:cation diffusion facilitator family transporter [Rectinemataceae bacterium]